MSRPARLRNFRCNLLGLQDISVRIAIREADVFCQRDGYWLRCICGPPRRILIV